MLEMNKVLLIGNLTRDPELSTVGSSGTSLAKASIALNRRMKDKEDEVAFIDIEAWGKTADFIAKYFSKGKRIFVEGRLKQDRWDDAKTGAKRSRIAVVADRVDFADGKADTESAGSGSRSASTDYYSAEGGNAPAEDSKPDDLPF